MKTELKTWVYRCGNCGHQRRMKLKEPPLTRLFMTCNRCSQYGKHQLRCNYPLTRTDVQRNGW